MKILFWILRVFNEGEPSNFEIQRALNNILMNDIKISKKIEQSMYLKVLGFSLEEIAKEMNCTRERIRMQIWKGCRVGNKNVKDE